MHLSFDNPQVREISKIPKRWSTIINKSLHSFDHHVLSLVDGGCVSNLAVLSEHLSLSLNSDKKFVPSVVPASNYPHISTATTSWMYVVDKLSLLLGI